MEQIILTGVGASGTIDALPAMGVKIRSIEIDVPLDEVGSTDPTVTVSGSATGAYTFHSDTTLDLEFQKGEDVVITTDSFTAEYSAIIRYLRFGDQRCYKAITSKHHIRPIPWRFR